ncbi:phage terminase small subunit P27 family [Fructobacillus americanaquae]|uniref:Phage terminase small subunit P27 family n=1 Tax=Fructobacillus americanaquae TaxID=2940302 RepID=A0ABY5C3Z5_9LACO|nr:phage terminase small subunit P27 family [Fructobacillus americanaquae]USS92026.1 phage terminase small subunit P27 family [Fructobacillus americanaquae]
MPKKSNKDVNGGRIRKDPPDYFGRLAGSAWRKVVDFLNDNKEIIRVDSGLIEMYCTQYEIYRNAYKHIQENGEVQGIYESVQNAAGEVIEKDFKGYKRNPMTQIYSDSLKNLTNIGKELGLSPKSRKELFDNLNDGDEEGLADIVRLFK